MIKRIFIVLFLLMAFTGNAQSKKKLSKDGWKKSGNITLLGSQSLFSNWAVGGSNSIALTSKLNYRFNYIKGGWTWDNRIIAKYGLSDTKEVGVRKTDDSFYFNSLVGKKTRGNWSYSFFLNLRSQFYKGFKYSKSSKITTSEFFSPGYLTLGPGIYFKKSNDFKINISPLSSKLTFVNDSYTLSKPAFGVDKGEIVNSEFGFYSSLYYKAVLMKNVSVENILNIYSNYLEKPQNIDVNYRLNFVMKINKYLSTNLSLHTIIDDDASSRIQFKEVFGLGISYVFYK